MGYVIAFILLYLFFTLGLDVDSKSSEDNSTASPSSSDDWSSAQEPEEEDACEEEDNMNDTFLAFMLAQDMYEREKKIRHAVCSKCRNANWTSDEDDNEYCECPYIGYLRPWEADWERYCEHYDESPW